MLDEENNSYLVNRVFELGHKFAEMYYGHYNKTMLDLDVMNVHHIIEGNSMTYTNLHDNITHKATLTIRSNNLNPNFFIKEYSAYGDSYFDSIKNLKNYIQELIIEYDYFSNSEQ